MNELPPLQVRFGDFQIDEGNARLSRAGQPVELPPKAFALLCTLLRQPGQLVLKDTLLDAVWGHRHVSESVLKTTISQLRGALADDARQPRYIETASRRGYRFIAALGSAAAAAADTADATVAHAGHDTPLPALIGRSEPLALLQACLANAQRGKRQVVLVAGEAGIGKTTLIDRFVAALPPSRAAYALGQCVEHYGAGEPYMPVLEALNMLCRGAAGAGVVELMRRVAPTWLVQLPWYLGDADRQQLQREVAGATQDRMLREFGELLDRCTAERPLLLVLEDLHWSDHATVQLIGYLARRRTPAALVLLGSFRPTEVIVEEHPLAGMRHELRLHRLCEELDLEALSEAEVGEMVAGRLDRPGVPEPFVRALHEHTEGLPLFVVNVLDELIAEGALRRDGAAWRFPDASGFSVPRNIVGVIEKQIARLPAQQQFWLGAASVSGAEFIHLPLADALQLAPAELQGALDGAAARQHWLRSAGVLSLPDGRIAARYTFRHALYRHVFYQRLGEAQRVQLHRKLAEALRAAYGPLAPEIATELAMHHERGQEPGLAIAQLMVVAGRALLRSAAREALHAARHALRLLASWPGAGAHPEIELDLRVLEGVALARLHVLSEPEVERAFERARELSERVDDSPARVRALHGLWKVSYTRGELAQARALAQRVCALAEASGDPALRLVGHSALGITLTIMGELREAQDHLDAALAGYASVRDALPPGMFVQDPGVEAMSYLAVVSWWRGDPVRARTLGRESLALAERLRHPISQLIAWHLDGLVHYFAGDYPRVLASTEKLTEVIRDHGLPSDPGPFSWVHGHAVAALGEPDKGLAEMRAAQQSCLRLGMHIGLTGFHLHYAEACRDAGRLDEALATVEQGLARGEATQERCVAVPTLCLKAELLHRRGDTAGAEASLRAALAVADAQGAAFHELSALVVASRMPGRVLPDLHVRLQERLAAYRDETGPAITHARAALETLEQVGAPRRA